ncbi:MAG TPA: hypothetical protein VJZ16_00110, partial [Syntrophales bacterium]|nr:hypothetical protein [Syntrophales bacterium]
GDEWNIRFSPLKFQIGAGGATSRDYPIAGALTTKATNMWYSADFQLEWDGWYFGSQWTRMSTDMVPAPALLPERKSSAYFAGLTKSFKLPNNQFLGVGFVWQHVDNEHPGRKTFMGPRSTATGGLTFNKGNSYHPVINYMFTPAIRLQIEYALYKEDSNVKEIDNNTLFTQFTFNF